MTETNAKVGLVHGDNRRVNVLQAMELVRGDLAAKVGEQVLVKPNLFSSHNQVTSTHVDAVRGVLDFLLTLPNAPREVIIAEGGNEKYSGEAFENYGYHDLIAEYPFDVRLVDLHQTTEWVETPVLQVDRSECTVRVPAEVVNHPCTISLAVAKTHDACVVTLGLKNMIMGTMHKDDRVKMHGCHTHKERHLPDEVRILNVNLARLAKLMKPAIAVVDGTVGLQGNGPGGTDSIDFGVVAASADVFAADAVTAKAMGFEPARLAQSWYGDLTGLGISDLRRIEILGADLDAVTMPFKPNDTTEIQWRWEDKSLEQYVAA
jgi:uncharacterized protein (DUF362 family)